MAEGARLHGDHIRPFGLARNDGSVSNSFVGIAGQSSREWPLGDTDAGPLQNNGGPTKTQALLSGSPAIDTGNLNGCTDGNGHLLKTDQRGKPRPDKEDTGGCDTGAFERQ
jgi:hypothetical protein